jgi:hypothetical protein
MVGGVDGSRIVLVLVVVLVIDSYVVERNRRVGAIQGLPSPKLFHYPRPRIDNENDDENEND